MQTQIHYSSMARVAMRQVRELSEDDFHSLRGLIILLSIDSIDLLSDDGVAEEDDLEYFGSGIWLYVYEDMDWLIVYRFENGREIMRVVAVRKVI